MLNPPPDKGEVIRSAFLKELAKNVTSPPSTLNTPQSSVGSITRPLFDPNSKWMVVKNDFTVTEKDDRVFSGTCENYRVKFDTGEMVVDSVSRTFTVFKHIGSDDKTAEGVGPCKGDVLYVSWNRDSARWETTTTTEKSVIVKPIRDVEPGTVGRCDIYKGPIGMEISTGETLLAYSNDTLFPKGVRSRAEHFTQVCGGRPRPLTSAEVSSEFKSSEVSFSSSDLLDAVASYELRGADSECEYFHQFTISGNKPTLGDQIWSYTLGLNVQDITITFDMLPTDLKLEFLAQFPALLPDDLIVTGGPFPSVALTVQWNGKVKEISGGWPPVAGTNSMDGGAWMQVAQINPRSA